MTLGLLPSGTHYLSGAIVSRLSSTLGFFLHAHFAHAYISHGKQGTRSGGEAKEAGRKYLFMAKASRLGLSSYQKALEHSAINGSSAFVVGKKGGPAGVLANGWRGFTSTESRMDGWTSGWGQTFPLVLCKRTGL